ncbi:MAG: cbb3-type cytochrome oxidase assembly protein CcoS [Burkholderiaceae bacterium]|jgi:cbb3-type cytochrome oxidase maturation protein|nr:cbb3-type cytochrome oxidase assembly protein CcoS [Burkholderiaceae bacterium]
MESMYLLIPVSLLLVLGIGGVLAWSVLGGQFDDLDAEGRRILGEDEADASLASTQASDTSETASVMRNRSRDVPSGGD